MPDITDLVKKKDFDDKLENSNKKVTLYKSKHVLVENEFKKVQDKIEKFRHMIQVFLSIRATFSVMDHEFT